MTYSRLRRLSLGAQLTGANILLTAPRRTGKTSLMREAARRLEQRGRDLAIYVDPTTNLIQRPYFRRDYNWRPAPPPPHHRSLIRSVA